MLNIHTNFVNDLQAVSLAQLDCVSLQNRIDSKYLLNNELFAKLLPFIHQNYKVLSIDNHRIFTYENNYFDTEDLQFYKDHHNGYLNRIKVRSRRYLETGTAYFEIKKKEKVSRTNKYRVRVADLIETPNIYQLDQIRSMSRKTLVNIHKVLHNRFNRITFVNHAATERMTLDFNILFSNESNEVLMGDIFVLEIKQSKSGSQSSIDELIRGLQIQEQGFSKYIYGVMALFPDVKKNNFKPLLRNIKNL